MRNKIEKPAGEGGQDGECRVDRGELWMYIRALLIALAIYTPFGIMLALLAASVVS